MDSAIISRYCRRVILHDAARRFTESVAELLGISLAVPTYVIWILVSAAWQRTLRGSYGPGSARAVQRIHKDFVKAFRPLASW